MQIWFLSKNIKDVKINKCNYKISKKITKNGYQGVKVWNTYEMLPNYCIYESILAIAAQKEITSQTDLYLVIFTSKTYVFEDKMTKY